MRYEFTGRHITVTPALKKHTREHLDKLDRISERTGLKRSQLITQAIADFVLRYDQQQPDSHKSRR